ncbi:MAG: hypothetical protein AABY22_04735 [Nanoarchaeota archaeon]|mgnify:CR=1 FL=1
MKTLTLTEKEFRFLMDIAWNECQNLHAIGDEDCRKESVRLEKTLNKLEKKGG